MEPVSRDLRRGVFWVGLPLISASLIRLSIEPHYWSRTFFLWLVLVMAYSALQLVLAKNLSPVKLRLALMVNFLAINVGYLTIGAALRPGGWRADVLVYGIDRRLFHGDPQRLLASIQAPWLSVAVTLGYLGFFSFCLFYLFLSEAFVLSPATGRLQLGLMRLYGLGFSGYWLLPASGPAFHHPALLPPIAHTPFTAGMHTWILAQCSQVDVCPSVHAAVCAFTMIWTYRRRRCLFPWLVAPSAALLLGTVYLQFHYFLDLPFGLLLGSLAAFSVLPCPISSPSPTRSAKTSA